MSFEPESRLRISPSLQPKPETKSRLVGRMLEGAATESPALKGKLLEAIAAAKERKEADKVALWQTVLVQGECKINVDALTGAVIAKRGDIAQADVSELVAPGSRIVRNRSDGNTEWSVLQFVEPRREGMPYRMLLEGDRGQRTGIPLDALMANPDENGRSWVIPIPTESI